MAGVWAAALAQQRLAAQPAAVSNSLMASPQAVFVSFKRLI